MSSSSTTIKACTPRVMKALEGVWRGQGRMHFPPHISPLHYTEELTIRAMAKPNTWEIRSATKNQANDKPMHIEVGFIRCHPVDENSGKIEICVVHPFGVSELSEGEYHDMTIEVRSTEEKGLNRVDTAKSPSTTALRRLYEVKMTTDEETSVGKESESKEGNVPSLIFHMDMATTSCPEIQNHLLATLYKV